MQVDGYTLVRVEAPIRPGYSGFCRGGRRWTEEPTYALVSADLLAVLRAERMLRVDSGADLPAGMTVDQLQRFDLPPRLVDEKAAALDEVRRLNEEIEREKAIAEAERKRAELAALRSGKTKSDQKREK